VGARAVPEVEVAGWGTSCARNLHDGQEVRRQNVQVRALVAFERAGEA